MFKFGVLGLFIFWMIAGILGAIFWPYTLNTWLVFLGKEPSVTWVQGLIIGLLPTGISQASIVAAVFTWIAMLFLA